MNRLVPLLAGLGALWAAGCVMPKGREVIVDRRVGSVFSGNAVLLEVSQDRLQCRIAYRNGTGIVEERWVPCAYVHGRPFEEF